jgi:hypothetical protein
VRVSLEEDPSISAEPLQNPAPLARAGVAAALNVVLDGVAARQHDLERNRSAPI